MSRYTVSYSEFIARLREVELLRAAAAHKELTDPVGLRNEINALCRGAIVLLSSHVEGYIKDVGEAALDAFFTKSVDRTGISSRTFYHISKDVIDEMRDTADTIKIADKIFDFIATDMSFWSKSGPFTTPIPADRFNRGFSNPKFRKVRAYFNRFGYEEYGKDFYAKLRADAKITENMLDHLVDIRNNIAHGDLSATKTPSDLRDMISIVGRFCRTTDDIFSNWCRDNYCSIR